MATNYIFLFLILALSIRCIILEFAVYKSRTDTAMWQLVLLFAGILIGYSSTSKSLRDTIAVVDKKNVTVRYNKERDSYSVFIDNTSLYDIIGISAEISNANGMLEMRIFSDKEEILVGNSDGKQN